MTLRLYNSLTRRKEDFRPDDPARVRMYVCGPTVYDHAHIGNARPVVVFDLLFRLLRHLFGEQHVIYVRNITDVDDKINARAAEEGVSIRNVTERTTQQFHADMAALGVLAPTVEPRATEHIAAMVGLIDRLIARGNAYEADGHVLFHVPSMTEYGRLSGRSLEEMIAGARVDVAPYKKDAMDFVLWKPSPPELPGWESPWGRGRPGWHIECSAMAWQHLGERFDIHGGGIDLIFPHHENEIAQSRSAFGTTGMATIWMHNGYLQVEGRKMSKSLGNFVTLNDVLGDWPGEVIRFNMLRTHYRQPMDWTVKGLEESSRVLAGFFASRKEADGARGQLHEQVAAALFDDLNTPEAINALHALDKVGNVTALTASLAVLGFAGNLADPRAAAADTVKIEARIAARAAARAARNWQESDRIREELAALGIVLKDNSDGTTTWELQR